MLSEPIQAWETERVWEPAWKVGLKLVNEESADATLEMVIVRRDVVAGKNWRNMLAEHDQRLHRGRRLIVGGRH